MKSHTSVFSLWLNMLKIHHIFMLTSLKKLLSSIPWTEALNFVYMLMGMFPVISVIAIKTFINILLKFFLIDIFYFSWMNLWVMG